MSAGGAERDAGGPIAKVALNVPIRDVFDYRIPPPLAGRVAVGARVRVPFGRRRMVGYVVGLADRSELAPESLKDVGAVVEEQTLLDESMMELTRWIADYYYCGWGEVLEAALPAGVRSARAGKRAIWFVTLGGTPQEAAARQAEIEPKSPAQARVLRTLIEVGGQMSFPDLKRHAKVSIPSIRSLARLGVVRMEKRVVEMPDPLEVGEVERVAPPVLTAQQQRAYDLIRDRLAAGRFGVVLVRGVTSSGKTEIYLQSIALLAGTGRQAIVLVPEISLTPQTVRHFRSRFERLAVLHSRLTDRERRDQWLRIRAGEVDVVIGARSAVFAPVRRLGMVVVDEEHENSFKQDSTPRYNARDVAVMRAHQAGALAVLGSATPSLESYQNALAGKYELVELTERIGRRPMPPVEVVDMTHERPSGRRFSYLSESLRTAIAMSLGREEQVILFINRRGFSPHVSCRRCGWVYKCDRCDIILTLHQRYGKCLCHFCGREFDPPRVCPECANPKPAFAGVGTERVEREVKALFPDKVVVRTDSDSMKARHALEEVLAAFRQREIDVLVGTQMIAKGLDFPRVTTVGVVWADTGLYLPDFRSRERTFQLVAQVAGRAGRGERGGRVIVQTGVPDDPSIQFAARHDFTGFAEVELAERRDHHFPPFARACRIIVQGRREEDVQARCEAIAARARERGAPLDAEVHGPAPAPVGRLKLFYRWHLMILCPRASGLRAVLDDAAPLLARGRGVQITVDVDPMSML